MNADHPPSVKLSYASLSCLNEWNRQWCFLPNLRLKFIFSGDHTSFGEMLLGLDLWTLLRYVKRFLGYLVVLKEHLINSFFIFIVL